MTLMKMIVMAVVRRERQGIDVCMQNERNNRFWRAVQAKGGAWLGQATCVFLFSFCQGDPVRVPLGFVPEMLPPHVHIRSITIASLNQHHGLLYLLHSFPFQGSH